MVDLLRTLTNPETGPTLDRLTKLLPAFGSPSSRSGQASPLPGGARYQGVERACLAVMMSARDPMHFRSIHAAVETLLGVDVSYSSVKNAVLRLADAAEKPITRVAPGLYASRS